MYDDPTARVAKGIEILDAHFPGWRERIDLDVLAITSVEYCPAAQASGLGDFDSALLALDMPYRTSANFGFLAQTTYMTNEELNVTSYTERRALSEREWDELQAAWIAALTPPSPAADASAAAA